MINILGFAVLIIVTVFAYKTAKDYERNAIGWALITFGVGFTIQIILPILIFILITIVMIASGSTAEKAVKVIPDITITMICLVLSVVAGFLILRYLSKIPEEKPFVAPPAPPTDFNQNT
jgi:hypothetical protein